LYRQKDWAASVEQYQHFLTLEQENPAVASEAWHNVGNSMLQQKDLQKSMEAYKMALRLNPEDDEARYNLAVVQKMLQDQEQEEQEQEQQEDQEQEQQQDPRGDSPQNPQDQEKRPEQQEGPEQMSRDNARQLLQAIEQDERDTQEKVQRMKAQEREERAQENRRRNKNW
jgi:tetratricopeptide (TPR) repeat protein